MIEDFYNTIFTTERKTEAKVDGRLQTVLTPVILEAVCAIFTPTSLRTIMHGTKEFTIVKNLYCSTGSDVILDDIITVDGNKFTVIYLNDTNNIGHHFQVGLSKK